MKMFFLNKSLSALSDPEAKILNAIREMLLLANDMEEVFDAEKADAIVIQEKNSFKNFTYIDKLQSDAIISAYPEKVFTINTDDCATGLLRGLYTSLPRYRFDATIYASVPYMQFPNDLVFSNNYVETSSNYLASWRGNPKSNSLRPKLVRVLKEDREFCVENTSSWLNHNQEEMQQYVNVIRNGKFSLCPAGWAPVSFRIYESMALGKCPVIIADSFVPPIGPDWNDFALFYLEKNIAKLPSFLRSKEHLACHLGRNAFDAWKRYFCSDVIGQYYANALLYLILRAPETTKEAEVRRWRSFKLFWSNKWTFPQRVINKLDKIGKVSPNVLN